MSLYSDTIRKWATDGRRAGWLPDADGTGEVGLASADAGRRLAVRFTLKVERDRIADVRYQVFGCGFSMAACAVAADLVVGYTLDEAQRINAEQLDSALDGLPSERRYCADLAARALQAALRSVHGGQHKVEARISADPEHGPRISPDHPVYMSMMSSWKPDPVVEEDRHLFACLLSVAAEEACGPAAALGLGNRDLDALLQIYFPAMARAFCEHYLLPITAPLVEQNDAVLAILLQHLPKNTDRATLQTAVWLAHMLAARAALPGHLWVAMGLTERPQLTAAIRRHLPSLAAANNQNMRWKRYLYKQVCESDGGVMCKAPNCGVCSDYALCFAG